MECERELNILLSEQLMFNQMWLRLTVNEIYYNIFTYVAHLREYFTYWL